MHSGDVFLQTQSCLLSLADLIAFCPVFSYACFLSLPALLSKHPLCFLCCFPYSPFYFFLFRLSCIRQPSMCNSWQSCWSNGAGRGWIIQSSNLRQEGGRPLLVQEHAQGATNFFALCRCVLPCLFVEGPELDSFLTLWRIWMRSPQSRIFLQIGYDRIDHVLAFVFVQELCCCHPSFLCFLLFLLQLSFHDLDFKLSPIAVDVFEDSDVLFHALTTRAFDLQGKVCRATSFACLFSWSSWGQITHEACISCSIFCVVELNLLHFATGMLNCCFGFRFKFDRPWRWRSLHCWCRLCVGHCWLLCWCRLCVGPCWLLCRCLRRRWLCPICCILWL